MEQRGRCREFKSKEEIRKQIESINQKYRTAGCAGADKANQERSFRGLRENDLREADPDNDNGTNDPADQKQLQGSGS